MKRKMSAILNQSESSLGSDHERRNTKKRCDREDAEDQIEQHEVSDKRCLHDQVETNGEAEKYCYYLCRDEN